MRKLIATLSLALSMLLGSAGVSASSNFWTGLDAYLSPETTRDNFERQRGNFDDYGWVTKFGVFNALKLNALKKKSEDGLGRDYATALREWKSSAELANANSMLMLGVMYEKGQGVPQDYIHAHMWLNLAESSGSVAAGNRRDVVARKMTPSQIEKAEVLAYKCVRKGFKGC